MKRPVVGVIGNSYRVEDRFAVQMAAERNLRAVADVSFDSLEDWAKIRAQLGSTRAVSDYDVLGLALHEAEISLSFFGRPEQLRDTLAQQNLTLTNSGGQYQLQLGGTTAANAP